MKSMMHTTRIDIPEKKRIEIIKILNQSLASATDLQMQCKQAHWNVKGYEFIALHKLFDELAHDVTEHVDTIAERITSLGGTALGTLQAAAKNTELKTYPLDIFSAKDHLTHLAQNFAILGKASRQNIDLTQNLDDMATSDMYIALTEMLDKNLWFIEAHLQK